MSGLTVKHGTLHFREFLADRKNCICKYFSVLLIVYVHIHVLVVRIHVLVVRIHVLVARNAKIYFRKILSRMKVHKIPVLQYSLLYHTRRLTLTFLLHMRAAFIWITAIPSILHTYLLARFSNDSIMIGCLQTQNFIFL